MSYFATVEVYKAGPGAESKIKETLREALPEETGGFMGLGVLGVAPNEDGGITIDVGGSIKEEDLELLQKSFDVLCEKYPRWFIFLDWAGMEMIVPEEYVPLKRLSTGGEPIVYDPYDDMVVA